MEILWQSLARWPANRKPTPENERRSRYVFKASWLATFAELKDELTKIGARDVVLEVDVSEKDLRRTGQPYAGSKPRTTPGVVLHFVDRNKRAVTMPCDRYETWEHNVRGIMLTLEALRSVDRHGVTTGGEQYAGWTALPPAGGTLATLSTNQAADMLARWSSDENENVAELEAYRERIKTLQDTARGAFRVAMNRTHPDRPHGDNQRYTLIQECGRILAAHFGVPKL